MPAPKKPRKPRISKAERERREAQAADNVTPIVPEGIPQELIPGVFVIRQQDEEGNINIAVQTQGDVKMTEVPTILAMALRQVKERMGLSD